MKKKNLFLGLVTLIPATFVALHSDPKLSIRTHLIRNGNIKTALNTDIVENEKYTALNDQADEKIYSLSQPAEENGAMHFNYKVKKKWFLYFSKHFLS